MKRTLKLERTDSNPEYLRVKICEVFPELVGATFKLWQLRENKTELTPLPVDVNNAQSLFAFDELNRSCVYIKADVSLYQCTKQNVHFMPFNSVKFIKFAHINQST